MFTVSSTFIASFKIGDNVNYNLRVLKLLYELSNEEWSRKALLRKPVIVTLVSITEAILYDFISRIQSPENVTTLPKPTIMAMKKKDYTRLANLVSGARSHDLFSASDAFYDQIDELRRLRNRVHIQNEKKHFQQNESDAFNAERQHNAERVLEYVSKFLAKKHPRSTSTHGFVGDFEFPWKEHYK